MMELLKLVVSLLLAAGVGMLIAWIIVGAVYFGVMIPCVAGRMFFVSRAGKRFTAFMDKLFPPKTV